MSRNRSFRKSFLGGVAIGALCLSAPAWAQEADPEATTDAADEAVVEIDEAAPEEEARQERITVTGSLLSRSEFQSASPIQVITAEVASLEGLVDSAAILQGSSIAAGSTQINGQFGGFVVDGGTGVNTVDLRGCGTTRTLVLINGKRPGPAGTRGAVGAFDLNAVPGSIVQRYDILKDSGSTIYGSDAVCGVVNIITKTAVDKPEINFSTTQPFEAGGEIYTINGAYGFNFDSGSISLAAEYQLQEELDVGDRDYLDCTEQLVYDPVTGEQVDRVNLSVTRGDSYGRRNCSNIYYNTVIDQLFGARLIPSPDGITRAARPGLTNPLVGYRPRANGLLPDGSGRSFYEDVLVSEKQKSTDAINRNELFSAYGVADFDLGLFGGTNWLTEVLYTKRKSRAEGWRQFFPNIGGFNTLTGSAYAYPNDPTWVNSLNSVTLPVTIWPSNNEVEGDYILAQTNFSGNIGATDFAWNLGGNYSVSDMDYIRNQIRATVSGDIFNPVANGDAPIYDPHSPDFLSGNYGTDVYNALTGIDIGNTEYTQWLVNGSVTGPLFALPAGDVAGAIGFEYREFEINDVPGEFTRAGDVWGSSTAGITAGTNSVSEFFGEIEIPLLKGQMLAEELTLNASGRVFEYDRGGDGDVYKLGLNWQVNPAIRLRATQGTSFRAPALFELFLDAQTSFAGQFGIDPCISDARRVVGSNIDVNCTADGLPNPFNNTASSSALIISGGNGDTLVPETSDSQTVGIVFTPSGANFNIAVDYFEFEISDQIGQLGASSILSACYNSDPAQFANNAFCDLITREPLTTPQIGGQIDTVEDYYLNIDTQLQRGIDMEARYEHEFDFGSLIVDVGGTWTLESLFSLFAPGTVDGVENNDTNSTIGDPNFVADSNVQLKRGNWTYTWFSDFVGNTSDQRFAVSDGALAEPYFGLQVREIYDTESTWYHGASVRWTGDTWTLTAGMRNIFDEAPPLVDPSAAAVRGNSPIVGTQYDLRGRRAFVQVSKTF